MTSGTGSPNPSPPPRPQVEPDPHRQPVPERGGWLVPGSEVFLPRQAEAGETVRGRAPVGSTVDFQGQRQTVPENGRFALQVPSDATGSLSVRIERPGEPVLVMRLSVDPDPGG